MYVATLMGMFINNFTNIILYLQYKYSNKIAPTRKILYPCPMFVLSDPFGEKSELF